MFPCITVIFNISSCVYKRVHVSPLRGHIWILFVATKREFSKVVKSPFEKGFLIPNITVGPAKTEIYPLNRKAKSKIKPSFVHGSPLSMPRSVSSNFDSTVHSPSSLDPGTPTGVSHLSHPLLLRLLHPLKLQFPHTPLFLLPPYSSSGAD